jgi:hypothetical protein
MLMRVSSIIGGAAALVALSLATAFFEARPAFAVVAAKLKSFACTSFVPCLTATNTGAWNGLQATSDSGNAVVGKTSASSSAASGVYGESDGDQSGYGVAGRVSGNVTSHALWADGGPNGATAMEIDATYAFPTGALLARNAGNDTLAVDTDGNVVISGLVYTSGSCKDGCDRRRGRVVTYGVMEAEPTVDDVGAAHLDGAETVVRIDPAFANVMDRGAGYTVLLSAEGDSSGLYVARREADRFIVRTADDAPASVDFSYRIVGHPYGVRTPRLPLVRNLLEAQHMMEGR